MFAVGALSLLPAILVLFIVGIILWNTGGFLSALITFVPVSFMIPMCGTCIVAAPLCHYGLAFLSHEFVEKNIPKTRTPMHWALRADYTMLWSFLSGSLDEKLRKAGVDNITLDNTLERI